MKRGIFVSVMILIVFSTAGCAIFARKSTAPQPYRPRAFALAVTVRGGLPPTPRQWAAIQAKAAQLLARHGWIVVTDLALADNILRIDFIPDPLDPENSGHAQVVGIRPNPQVAIASTSSIGRYPTGFSYLGTFQNASWGYGGFSNNYYYGWGSSYSDGYSYGAANLNPTSAPLAPPAQPTHPPHRHHPGAPEECPSPSDNYIRRHPGWDGFASYLPGGHPSGSRTGDRGRWRGGEDGPSAPIASYVRSDTTASLTGASDGRTPSSGWGAERTPSRAAPSPSLLEHSYSRSGGLSGSSRPEGYSRSDASDSRSERAYSRSESSRSWQDRSDSSNWRSEASSSSRPERSYSRSESSGSSERSYSRSDSSYSRSESSHSRSESSHSYSRSSDSSSSSSSSGSSSSSAGSSASSSSSGSSGATDATAVATPP